VIAEVVGHADDAVFDDAAHHIRATLGGCWRPGER
jgi:hypothetical protein